MSMNTDIGQVAAEAIEVLETTSVDGRTFVSIEDVLVLVHGNIDALHLFLTNQAASTTDLNEVRLFTAIQRAEGMAAILAQFDTIFHALEDKERLEGLCPGDFQ